MHRGFHCRRLFWGRHRPLNKLYTLSVLQQPAIIVAISTPQHVLPLCGKFHPILKPTSNDSLSMAPITDPKSHNHLGASGPCCRFSTWVCFFFTGIQSTSCSTEGSVTALLRADVPRTVALYLWECHSKWPACGQHSLHYDLNLSQTHLVSTRAPCSLPTHHIMVSTRAAAAATAVSTCVPLYKQQQQQVATASAGNQILGTSAACPINYNKGRVTYMRQTRSHAWKASVLAASGTCKSGHSCCNHVA